MGIRLGSLCQCTKNIQKIKENIQILQNKNKLQQDQILELVHFLNLTLVQVKEHQEALYKLDTKLLIVNKSPMPTMQVVSYLRYTVAVSSELCTGVTHFTSGILSLKENVILYEYLVALASESSYCNSSRHL